MRAIVSTVIIVSLSVTHPFSGGGVLPFPAREVASCLAPRLHLSAIQSIYVGTRVDEDSFAAEIRKAFSREEIYLYAQADDSHYYWDILVKRGKDLYREWHKDQKIAYDNDEEKIKAVLQSRMKELFEQDRKVVRELLVSEGLELKRKLAQEVLDKHYGDKTGRQVSL